MNTQRLRNKIQKRADDLMVESLFHPGGTLSEKEALEKAYVIERNHLYFIEHDTLKKLLINGEGMFVLGFDIEKFGHWYYQFDHERHPGFVTELYKHLRKQGYVTIQSDQVRKYDLATI